MSSLISFSLALVALASLASAVPVYSEEEAPIGYYKDAPVYSVWPTLEKRAGFQAARGKKSLPAGYDMLSPIDEFDFVYKRSANARKFSAARGKRSVFPSF